MLEGSRGHVYLVRSLGAAQCYKQVPAGKMFTLGIVQAQRALELGALAAGVGLGIGEAQQLAHLCVTQGNVFLGVRSSKVDKLFRQLADRVEHIIANFARAAAAAQELNAWPDEFAHRLGCP